MSGHSEPVPAAMDDHSDAYWLGCLSEHLRAVLGAREIAAGLAVEALADYDAWCARQRTAQRDG